MLGEGEGRHWQGCHAGKWERFLIMNFGTSREGLCYPTKSMERASMLVRPMTWHAEVLILSISLSRKRVHAYLPRLVLSTQDSGVPHIHVTLQPQPKRRSFVRLIMMATTSTGELVAHWQQSVIFVQWYNFKYLFIRRYVRCQTLSPEIISLCSWNHSGGQFFLPVGLCQWLC